MRASPKPGAACVNGTSNGEGMHESNLIYSQARTVRWGTCPSLDAMARRQLLALGGLWFDRSATDARDLFMLMAGGSDFGAVCLEVSHVALSDRPELALYDYWHDPKSGAGAHFFAGTTENTIAYDLDYEETNGVFLVDTIAEAVERAERNAGRNRI